MAWRFEVNTNPTDYLRKLISMGRNIDEADREKLFNIIFDRIRRDGIKLDMEREEILEEKRDLRTNFYGGEKTLTQ